MTSKFINDLQTISVRPQNDQEKIMLNNYYNLSLMGKEVTIKREKDDIIFELRSKK